LTPLPLVMPAAVAIAPTSAPLAARPDPNPAAEQVACTARGRINIDRYVNATAYV